MRSQGGNNGSGEHIKIARSIAQCLETPNGQIMLKHLKMEYNDKSTFAFDGHGRMDACATIGNEGARAVYRALESILETYKKGELKV